MYLALNVDFLIHGVYFYHITFKLHQIVTGLGLFIFTLSLLVDFAPNDIFRFYINVFKCICALFTFILLIFNYSLISNLLFVFLMFEPIKFLINGGIQGIPIPDWLRQYVRIVKIVTFIITLLYLYIYQNKIMCPFPYCE